MKMLNATLFASLLVAGLATAHAAPSPVRELVVGQSLALTGNSAEASRQYRQASQCFFDNLNRNGGIRGSTIRLVSLDDGGSAGKAVENARLLLERDKAFALFNYTPDGAQARIANGSASKVFHFPHVVPDPNSPTAAVSASYRGMLAGCGVREAPSAAGLQGFIAARILAEGLNRAGSGATPEKVIEGLESIDRLDLGGFQVGASPEGDAARFVEMPATTRIVKVAR
jgi:ABC-type branched-subunit amino acid transport system substrate-binding protein